MPVKKQHNQNAGLGTQNQQFYVGKTQDTKPETGLRPTCGLSRSIVLGLGSSVSTENVPSSAQSASVLHKGHV
jgi:hypothetical protein